MDRLISTLFREEPYRIVIDQIGIISVFDGWKSTGTEIVSREIGVSEVPVSGKLL